MPSLWDGAGIVWRRRHCETAPALCDGAGIVWRRRHCVTASALSRVLLYTIVMFFDVDSWFIFVSYILGPRLLVVLVHLFAFACLFALLCWLVCWRFLRLFGFFACLPFCLFCFFCLFSFVVFLLACWLMCLFMCVRLFVCVCACLLAFLCLCLFVSLCFFFVWFDFCGLNVCAHVGMFEIWIFVLVYAERFCCVCFLL